MSFGVGVGDFLAVGRLVLDLYNACKDAPGEFQEICRELSSIHTVLSGLATQAQDPTSLLIKQGKERIPEWTKIQENLEFTLGELQDLVKRYYKMGRNAWLRIQFVSENLTQLRGRLNFHLNVINAFVGSLSLSALGRMEPALGRIEVMLRESVQEERRGDKEPTVLSAYENNDSISWEKVERDLALEGVSKQEFEKNKDRIKELLNWVVEHGADLATLKEVGIGDSVSQTGDDLEDEVIVQSQVLAQDYGHKVPTATQLKILETWTKTAIPRRGARGILTKEANKRASGIGRMFSTFKAGDRKYTYNARAIENYKAQRPNELSYTKDERLEVAPGSGEWWPARNANAKKGIISSDAFVLESEIIWEEGLTQSPFTRLWNRMDIELDDNLYPLFYYGKTYAKAWARESYDAPPWCANDLSFKKHELLELSAASGLWWMARNEGGEIGTVPADHLVVLWSKDGLSKFHLTGKEGSKTIWESASLDALRRNENGVFDKFLSTEAILRNWG
ncbi:hypothetical protein EG329_013592 [Mollisiaceae sp. DMI_Dod_QoI]|nr:hypothetical protein EG329_013592 [Helotiales sp. DMI_Dod_QoI]